LFFQLQQQNELEQQQLILQQQQLQLLQQRQQQQLSEQQRLLKMTVQQTPSKLSTPTPAPSLSDDTFLFGDVVAGELTKLKAKTKFDEIYVRHYDEKDLEEMQLKMVKQFRALLAEYERLMIGYIAEQNRTKFEKVFEENEILKKKSAHYESEYTTLKAKYETLNSAHQQALRELAVHRAKVQVQESRIKTLEQQLALKLTENEKLTQLCDELITRLENAQSS
jgi:exonuclease SbcC